MRLWWNWKTRSIESAVSKEVQVQILLAAPYMFMIWRQNWSSLRAVGSIPTIDIRSTFYDPKRLSEPLYLNWQVDCGDLGFVCTAPSDQHYKGAITHRFFDDNAFALKNAVTMGMWWNWYTCSLRNLCLKRVGSIPTIPTKWTRGVTVNAAGS